MKEVIGPQGEVNIFKIKNIPENIDVKKIARVNGQYIIGHSESGHHHVLTDGDVMERIDVPSGMKIFYAIVDKPAEFIHEAPAPHEGYKLEPGIYEFRISREYNPFTEQARIVQD